MNDKETEGTARGWEDGRESYMCRDGNPIDVLHKSANVRDLDAVKSVPGSQIRYAASGKEIRITVSGVEFCRCMTEVLGGSDGITTLIFPDIIRSIRQGSFRKVKSLRSVVLNEGLETLGTDEHTLDDSAFCGVFQESGLRNVRLPSTLKVIRNCAFLDCSNLKSVSLPDGLKEIGLNAFSGSGLERVAMSPSMEIIH